MGRVEGRIKIESYFQRGEKRRERKIDVDVEARRVYIRYTYKWVGWIKASVVTFHVSRYIFFPLSLPPLSRLELRFSDFSRRYFSRGKYLRVLFFTRFACLYRFEILCLRCPFFLSFFFIINMNFVRISLYSRLPFFLRSMKYTSLNFFSTFQAPLSLPLDFFLSLRLAKFAILARSIN